MATVIQHAQGLQTILSANSTYVEEMKKLSSMTLSLSSTYLKEKIDINNKTFTFVLDLRARTIFDQWKGRYQEIRTLWYGTPAKDGANGLLSSAGSRFQPKPYDSIPERLRKSEPKLWKVVEALEKHTGKTDNEILNELLQMDPESKQTTYDKMKTDIMHAEDQWRRGGYQETWELQKKCMVLLASLPKDGKLQHLQRAIRSSARVGWVLQPHTTSTARQIPTGKC